MSLTITQHLVNGFDNNCAYTCIDTSANTAVVVDPSGDIMPELTNIPENITISAVWLTHTHQDHLDKLGNVLSLTGALPIYVHKSGASRLTHDGYNEVIPITEGDAVMVGNIPFTVLHTPGHSEDSVCFYYEGDNATPPALLSGDTLFVQGCGRTSQTEASTLYSSLQRIASLPANTRIFPGYDYGPTSTSTLASELEFNQFLRAYDYESFIAERFPTT